MVHSSDFINAPENEAVTEFIQEIQHWNYHDWLVAIFDPAFDEDSVKQYGVETEAFVEEEEAVCFYDNVPSMGCVPYLYHWDSDRNKWSYIRFF